MSLQDPPKGSARRQEPPVVLSGPARWSSVCVWLQPNTALSFHVQMFVIYQPYLMLGVRKTIVNTEKHTKWNCQNGPWSGTLSAARLSLNTLCFLHCQEDWTRPSQLSRALTLSLWPADLSYLKTQGTPSTNNRPLWPLSAVSAAPRARADHWHLRAGCLPSTSYPRCVMFTTNGTQLQATSPLKNIKGLK